MNSVPPDEFPRAEGHDGTTLVDILMSRSRSFPDRLAFRFLEDEIDSATLTYNELDQAARQIAAGLLNQVNPGDSVALVFPPGLDFIKAFLGCAYAGVLAIPATYPKPRRPSARLSAIVDDARPAAMLATQRVVELQTDSENSGHLGSQNWLSISKVGSASASQWKMPEIGPSNTAFLQYTSGSTKDPRGVVVSHGNIMHNLEMIRKGFGLSCEAAQVGVSWLPAYHDMGLIGGILESLYVGGTTVLMSPLSFLQRPSRWLRTISNYRAVVSGAPNFAYELCLKKIKPGEIEDIDLSSWRVAFSGAEPIRSLTMRRFAEKFGRYGFSDSSFYPCYGLAEATLLVTGGHGPGKLATCVVDPEDLQKRGHVTIADPNAVESLDDAHDGMVRSQPIELVNCGRPPMNEEVLIVDPETRLPCGENRVGEIWIRGPHVARGYHDRPEDSALTFNGQLADSGEGGYLRSGDLGFIRDGSLYVTGRRKELLIIRGRNHYPHDLEATVQNSHEKLIPGGGGAFLVENDGGSHLVLVQEVDRGTSHAEREAIIPEIRRNVTAEHDVFVHEVILIRMGTLPRTTSGKVRYADIREQYRRGELQSVCQWSFASTAGATKTQEGTNGQSSVADLTQWFSLSEIDDAETLGEEIETLLTRWLRQESDAHDTDFDPHRPFADYGLDSLASMELIAQLESGLDLKLSPTIAWTYPSPSTLARHLAHMITRRKESSSANNHESDTDAEADAMDELSDHQFDQLLAELEQMPDSAAAAMLAAQDQTEPRQ
ncbi:AMP-binding protein [Aporhodopirellula aestuarii]|uniref:AMP-binding protein n=1 Tax=Aporhodopirellula aestuarii TaxID=2950107 RepID=A0ABT0TX96_9BACT|nr:AMP-binding protein [Aporhodopirellula aestuarii]MCM2369160.1 AMP-binding protein [Aporhodopirellula aestuarii]